VEFAMEMEKVVVQIALILINTVLASIIIVNAILDLLN